MILLFGLYDRIPEHVHSAAHRQNYLKWRTFQRRLVDKSSIDIQLEKEIVSAIEKWREVLKRIIDVVLFLGERGLAFRGLLQLIGSPNNGNFLVIIELISHYDPVLADHVRKVQESQASGHRLSAHYLSSDSQNEFIAACAHLVRTTSLEDQKLAKYFSSIVDATPDSSHTEQTTFIIRYVACTETFSIHERFVEFLDCNKKTGAHIAQLIIDFCTSHGILLSNCRGQG